MKNKYYLLSKKTKIILWVLAICISLGCNYFINRDYLQHNMLGTWTMQSLNIDSNSNNENKNKNKKLEITTKDIKIDGQTITKIKYGSRSKNSNFKRVDKKDILIYGFSKGDSDDDSQYYDYAIVIDKKDPLLIAFSVLDEGETVEQYFLTKEISND